MSIEQCILHSAVVQFIDSILSKPDGDNTTFHFEKKEGKTRLTVNTDEFEFVGEGDNCLEAYNNMFVQMREQVKRLTENV